MSKWRVTFAALVAMLALDASAWWETQVVTNSPAMTAQSYATNGLVAMWDGIENAGWGTHDASITTWNDLISGFSIPVNISGLSVTDNSITSTSKNADSYFEVGESKILSQLQASKNLVVEVSFYAETNSGECNMFGCGGMYVRFFNNNQVQCQFTGQSSDPQKASADVIGRNTFTVRRIDNAIEYYFNGSLLLSQNYSLIGTSYGSCLNGYCTFTSSGVDVNWHNGIIGAYHSIRVYDTLPPDEIAHNYAVDKQRFVDGYGNNPIVTTNRVYHANPPQTAYDAASPWNATERTRIGGDSSTLRPSATIKEN